MGLGAVEVQTEQAVEIVVGDRLVAMGFAVDGGCIDMAVVLHQDGAAAVGEVNADVDVQQDVGIRSRPRNSGVGVKKKAQPKLCRLK